MKFKSISIEAWKQFEKIKIDLHHSITIITGANCTGKTTILAILSRHFGWNRFEIATPSKDIKSGIFKFVKRFFKIGTISNEEKIGEILYNNGRADLLLPKDDVNTPRHMMPGNSTGAQYNILIQGQQNIAGLNIPSHRPVYFYQPVQNISTQKRSKEDAYNLAKDSMISRYQNNGPGIQTTNYFLKETLLNWAVGGAGNEFIESDKELYNNYKGFEDVLKTVLPSNLGFKKISIRSYEIVFETVTGDFMIDAASGGISSIIDLAWQIYACPKEENGECVVLIDEIENHLHPSMQRRILPDFTKAFPEVQFIVSTHSPLIVGSVKNSKVFVLRYNDSNRVESEELDLVNKAKTATQILNDVLGVPVTLPIWAETDLTNILSKYTIKDSNEISLAELKKELQSAGLEEYFPEAITKLLNGR